MSRGLIASSDMKRFLSSMTPYFPSIGMSCFNVVVPLFRRRDVDATLQLTLNMGLFATTCDGF